ncbi:hypothetical protein SprV_0702378100 [Sparganum proliferum]
MERAQEMAKKMVKNIDHLPYETRLAELNMFPINYRKLRGVEGDRDWALDFDEFLELAGTDRLRGHSLKPQRKLAHTDVRRNASSQRAIGAWNEFSDATSCRRVADQAAHLVDALLIFKTWMIQTQAASRSNQHQHIGSDGANSQTSVSPQSLELALRRAERAENAANRMRAGCLAMRRQVEVGLGYRREIERLRNEVQMCQRTIANYQSVINEGTEFRNDLKAELERARKAASVARAQLANELRRRTSSTSSSTAASTVPEFAYPLSPTSNSGLRAECDRLQKWLSSLKEENRRLEASLVAKTSQEIILIEKLDRVRQLVSSQLAQLRKRQRSRRRRHGRASSPTGLSWLREVALLVGLPEAEVSELIKPSLATTTATTAVTASSPRRLTHSAALESVLNDLSTTVSDISDADASDDMQNRNRMPPPPPAAAALGDTSLSRPTAPNRSQCSRPRPASKPHNLSDDSDEEREKPEEKTRRRKRRLHDRSTSAATRTRRSMAVSPGRNGRSAALGEGVAKKRRCRRRSTAFADTSGDERDGASESLPPPPPPPPPRRRRQRLDSTASAVSCLSAVTSVMLEDISLAGLQKADDSDLSFVIDEASTVIAEFARTKSPRRVSGPHRGNKLADELMKESELATAIKSGTLDTSTEQGRARNRSTLRNSGNRRKGSRLVGRLPKAVDLDASPHRPALPASAEEPLSPASASAKDAEPSTRRCPTRETSTVPRQRGSPPLIENDVVSDSSTSPPVLRPSTSPEPDRLPSPHPVSAKDTGPARLSSRLCATRKVPRINLDLDADMPAGRVITHPKVCRRRGPSVTPSTVLPLPTVPAPSPSAVISQILNAHYPAGVADWFNLLTSDDLASVTGSLEGAVNEGTEKQDIQKAALTIASPPSQSQLGHETASPPQSPPPLQRPQVIDSKSLSTTDSQQPTPSHSAISTSVHLSLGTVTSPHSPPIGSIPRGSFIAPSSPAAEIKRPEVDQELSVEEAVLHYLLSAVTSASTEEALGTRLRQLDPTVTGACAVLSALLRLRTGAARETCITDVTTVPESERRAARLLIASSPPPLSPGAVLQPSLFLTWLTKQRSSLSLCQFFRLAQIAFLGCPPHAVTGLVYSVALLVNGATGWVLKPPLPVTCLLVAADSAVPGLWRQRLGRSGNEDVEYSDPLAVTAEVRFGGADGPTAYALQLSSLQHLVAVEVAACGSQSSALSRPLIRRLVATGWLPRDSDAAATADAPARLVLAVEVQRTRDFLLFLVDECLGVQRQRGRPLKADTPLRPPNAEAGLALRFVLSLVAFTDLAQGDSEGKQKPTNSRQRKLKNREAKSIRFGTLGWLLCGRLLPWLTSLKTLKTSCPVVERRLAVLCTDVLLLGVQLDLARGGGSGSRKNSSINNFQRGLALCAERLCNLLLLCPSDEQQVLSAEQLFSLLRLLPARPSAICEALESREVTAIDMAWLSHWEPQRPPSFTSYPTERAVDLLSPLLTQSSSCLEIPTGSCLSHLLDSCRLTLQGRSSP